MISRKEEDYTPEFMHRIPIQGIVDFSEFKPIIDHEIFQRLLEKKQTGLLYKVYSGAQHSRFEHSLGVFQITKKMANQLRLSEEESKAVMAYALLHDIGHIPFSHNIEPLLSNNHDVKGKSLIWEFKDALEQCDIDPNYVFAIAREEDSLHQLVKHGVIGADRLDYLSRDSYHIGRDERIEIENMVLFLVYDRNNILVEEKNVDEVIAIQELYYRLYNLFYHRKQYLINNRILQRAAQETMENGDFQEDELHSMVDADLEAALKKSSSPLAKDLFDRIRNRSKTYKSLVVFRLDEYTAVERVANKKIKVYPISEGEKNTFQKDFDQAKKLTELEKEMCSALGYSDGTFLVSAILDFERVSKPKDTLLYSRNGEIVSLFDRYPYHKESLLGKADAHFSFRVAVKVEERDDLYSKVEEIKDFIKEKILV